MAEQGGGKVGLAAENQLAIALSRRSAIRWLESGPGETANVRLRAASFGVDGLREGGEGWWELKGPRG